MSRISVNIILLLFITIGLGCNHRKSENKSIEDYFEQQPPDKNPTLFAPELLGKGNIVRDITFSIDYKEFFFTQITSDTFIMTSKYESGEWTKPEVASFSGSFTDIEPHISPDGNSLYFASVRPSKDKPSMKNDIDLWKVERTSSGWSNPILLDTNINTKCMEYYPSITKAGVLYFGRNDSALTRGDIYSAHEINNSYTLPKILPKMINVKTSSFNAFISPDESYLIFSKFVQNKNFWHADLYISYRDENGKWELPLNLGKEINSLGNEYSPWISYDNKYLFFTSSRLDTSGQNMKHNIFWVRTTTIHNFLF